MKRFLIIILIIILVLGGFFYFKNKQSSTNTNQTKSGFRDFFNFGSKNTTSTETPENETGGNFTPEENTASENGTSDTNQNPSSSSVFGTNGPFTPTMQGGLADNGGISGTGGINGGGISDGGGVTGGGGVSGTGNTGGGSGGGGSINPNQCGPDDTVIEFTPEEIARLRVLEDRFYDLAPTLRSQSDVQSELANYSSYKLLNQKYSELINYCESKSPLLPSNINKRVSTPLYTNASASAYFSEGPDADGIIDMQSSTQKPKEVEKFFRINIW